jgi:hypothetical protein
MRLSLVSFIDASQIRAMSPDANMPVDGVPMLSLVFPHPANAAAYLELQGVDV